MKDLTYTIIRIQVGAEKYWEEVEGFVSGDKKELILNNSYYRSEIEKFLHMPASISSHEMFCAIKELMKNAPKELKFNYNHPLSDPANKLGAKIYGGFEDDRDFYLVLPTVEEIGKSGDVYIKNIIDEYDDYEPWIERVLIKNLFIINDGPNSSVIGFSSRDGKDFRCDTASMSKVHYAKYFTPNGNIFQEYARTGIIENDLYKQFFK